MCGFQIFRAEICVFEAGILYFDQVPYEHSDQQRTLICLPDRLAFFHAHRGKIIKNTAKTRKIRSWSGQTDCLMAGFFAFRGKNRRKTLVLIWSFFVLQRKFALTKQRDLNHDAVLFRQF